MWDRWLEKNVDLTLLVERIRQFFREVDFETTVEKVRKGYMIRAVSKIPNLNMRINVKIVGQPNDFKVEFSAGGKGGYFSPSMIAGYLTTMFGGGYVLSREARKRETLDMLERDFWRHTQMQVADLVNSVTHANRDSERF
ncbi:MAG: hypothetical protein ACE5R6_21010 [Candidatus Heimdallarchaeota archaeon]